MKKQLLLMATIMLSGSGILLSLTGDPRVVGFEGGEEGPSQPAKKPETGPVPERQPGKPTEPQRPPVVEPARGPEEGGVPVVEPRGRTTVPELGPERGGVSVPEKGSAEETLAAIERALDDIKAMTSGEVTDVSQKISTLASTNPAAAIGAIADSLEKSATELPTATGGIATRIRQFVINLIGLLRPSVIAAATQDVRDRIATAARNAIASISTYSSDLAEVLGNTVQEAFNPNLPKAYDFLQVGPRTSEEAIREAYDLRLHDWQDNLEQAIARKSIPSQDVWQSRLNLLKINFNSIARNRGWAQVE
jgi:hypothetical protein